jgi:molybdate transport system substrate-binding protein
MICLFVSQLLKRRVSMPRFRCLILLALLALLSACGSTPAAPAPTMLNVFAAASLTEAFTEIGKSFEATHPGTTVAFNFAGSQQLAQQIAQGAPADVFASANTSQMNALITSGQVVSGTQETFARNRLVVITPKENPGKIGSLNDLAKSGIKLVLADKSVPVGGYSLTFLDKASKQPEYTSEYSPTVLKNVVSYEENVKAVLSKVTLGEADAGIVYTSDISRAAADKVNNIDIPDELNVIASYPIAPVKNSKNAATAQQFVTYVLSSDGQDVLEKYGFLPVAR